MNEGKTINSRTWRDREGCEGGAERERERERMGSTGNGCPLG